MQILTMTLHRNKRLQLLKSETFTYMGLSPHTVLRGTSGYGKSTILYELSPLPAYMRDYHEGGYKAIKIAHQGKTYELYSEGRGAGKHSFIMDGEELNTGKTLSVQYQLVEQHFQYTKAIHEVMVGIERFTRMAQGTRRDWFMKMAKTDTVWVQSLWEAIKAGKRDVQGALKDTSKKITEHTSELAKAEDLETDKTRIEQFKQVRDGLIRLRERYKLSIPEQEQSKITSILSTDLGKLLTYYETFTQSILTLNRKNYPFSVKDLESKLTRLKETLHPLWHYREQCLKQLEPLTQQEQSYQFDQSTSGVELERLLSEFQSRKAQFLEGRDETSLKTQLASYLDQKPVHALVKDMQDYLVVLRSSLTEWKDDLQAFYQTESIGVAKTAEILQSLGMEINEIKRKLEVIQTRLEMGSEHLRQLSTEPDHTCPQCQFTFKAGTVETKVKDITEKMTKYREHIPVLEQSLEEKTTRYEMLSTRVNLYRRMRDRLDETPFGYLFFISLSNSHGTRHSTSFAQVLELPYGSLLKCISELPMTLEILSGYLSLVLEEEHLRSLQEKQNKLISPEYLSLTSEIKRLETALDETNLAITEKEKEQVILEDILRYRQVVDKHYQQVIDLSNKIMEYYESSCILDYHAIIDEMIFIVQSELSEYEARLQKQYGIEYLLSHLNTSKLSLEMDIQYHDIIMEVLNPKDGLMAKSLMGFVRSFTAEMNKLIAQVWTYPLEITLDEEGNFMKDYKFPVLVEDELTPDVANTSMGQSEMIDLAFRLTMAKHLGLPQWCIYADELGSNLNPRYRYNLYNLLKRLLDEHRFSQLFVITHLADIAQVMSNGQEIELDNYSHQT